MKKKLMAGALITALSAGALVPVNTLAAPVVVQNAVSGQVVEIPTVSNALGSLATKSPLTQAYALVLLQQQNVTVAALPTMTLNQQTAKVDATAWNNQYNVSVVQMNQRVLNFNTQFTSYYDELLSYADSMATDATAGDTVISGIQDLRDELLIIQASVAQTTRTVKDFGTSLATSSKSFSDQAAKAVTALDSTKLREDIKTLQADFDKNLKVIIDKPKDDIKGGISVAKNTYQIASTAASSKTIDFTGVEGLGEDFGKLADNTLTEAFQNLASDRAKIKTLTSQLSEKQLQATAITFVEGQVTSFTQLVNEEAVLLDQFSKDFKSLDDMLAKVASNIELGYYTTPTKLKNDLAKVKFLNATLNGQAKLFQTYATQVKVG